MYLQLGLESLYLKQCRGRRVRGEEQQASTQLTCSILFRPIVASLVVVRPSLEDAPLVTTADVALVPLDCNFSVASVVSHSPAARSGVYLVARRERPANPILIRVLQGGRGGWCRESGGKC